MDEEFEADFVCQLCGFFGENESCPRCDVRACARCLRRCCSPRPPPPPCVLCARRERGHWACRDCERAVCAYCAPTDKTPPGFCARDRCLGCAKQIPRLALLDPLLAEAPVHLRLAVERALVQS